MDKKYNNFLTLKAVIKKAAASQRSNRQLFKQCLRSKQWTSDSPRESTLQAAKKSLRLHHVAYCLARGRSLADIEGQAKSKLDIVGLSLVMVSFFGFRDAAELLLRQGLIDGEKASVMATKELSQPTVWGERLELSAGGAPWKI